MDFKKKLVNIIKKAIDLEERYIVIDPVPRNFMNDFDYVLSCFKLVKIFKKDPNEIAVEIYEKISIDLDLKILEKIEVFNAYVNFRINRELFTCKIIREIVNKKENFLKNNIGKNKVVLFDYSSPNIAKPFHVGHLRSTIIGNVLKNIFKVLGYKTISINHLGDWGTQFGKLITAYKLWGNKEKDININFLNKLYIKFHKESEKNKELNKTARDNFIKMQNDDPENIGLWKLFNNISLSEFKKSYENLGINFDFYIGESFFNDKMDFVIKELNKKKLLIKSNDASIVDLSDYKMSPCLILKSDGGTLYPTRDIAAAIYRMNKFNFYKCIYVTAIDQNLHFAQFFKVLELMGYKWAKNLIHVSYGLVNLEDGKISTRHGKIILMQDLLNQAIDNAKKIILEKNPKLKNKDKTAEIIGINSVIFNYIYNSRTKNIIFSWERALNFEGETGPYVQYTFVRTCSILKKSKLTDFDKLIKDIDFNVLSDNISWKIAKILYEFKEKIIESSEKLEPCVISRHIMNLAQAFNEFYRDNIILDNNNKKTRDARLILVYCVNMVLKLCLDILGMKTCETM
ncbi:MAG: arginine--tRNA ligase [Clostridiales bacterium]|jgi:arginyl-tRNA synthetase|nr:arginine--tRNA ligase [Clostridiales bacterium]